MSKTKVHRIVICVVDHDGLGADEVKVVLENANYPNDCIRPRIASIETREVDWSDDHPLNRRGAVGPALAQVFSAGEKQR